MFNKAPITEKHKQYFREVFRKETKNDVAENLNYLKEKEKKVNQKLFLSASIFAFISSFFFIRDFYFQHSLFDVGLNIYGFIDGVIAFCIFLFGVFIVELCHNYFNPERIENAESFDEEQKDDILNRIFNIAETVYIEENVYSKKKFVSRFFVFSSYIMISLMGFVSGYALLGLGFVGMLLGKGMQSHVQKVKQELEN